MKAPVEITTPFPTVWETARTLGVSKKRVAELEALSGWSPTRPSFLRQLKMGTLEIMILATLSKGDWYGSDISRQLRDRSQGFFEFDQDLLYSTLRRMEEAKLVMGYWRDSATGGNDRKYYRLTRQGRVRLAESLEAWKDFAKHFDKVLHLARH